MAHAAGGTPTERLLRRLDIRGSDDTILRHLPRTAQVASPGVRIIRIDDWSWRKAPIYGTIIIDLERRAVILRVRKADPLSAWIDDAIETDLGPILRFARTINRSTDAVSNAIEIQWSNGQAS